MGCLEQLPREMSGQPMVFLSSVKDLGSVKLLLGP